MICLLIQSKWKMDALGKVKRYKDSKGLYCWYALVLCVSVLDILGRNPYIRLPFQSVISALMPLFVLYCVVLVLWYDRKTSFSDISYRPLVYIFLFYNLTIIVRGYLRCEDYWDFKDVSTKFGSLTIPAVTLLGFRPLLYQKIYKYLLSWYMLGSLIICSHVFYPVQGLPLLFALSWLLIMRRTPWFWCLIVFVFFSIYGNFGSRGWIIRAVFALASALVLRFVDFKDFVFKSFYVVMIVMPLSLVYLGYNGRFNVFAMEEYITTDDEDLVSDTRTGLYERVQVTLENESSTFFGIGARSEYWQGFLEQFGIYESARKHGRSSTESGLLNFYLMGGWVGAILYSLVFWFASFLAIFRSESKVCKFLGMFVLFRWVTSFIDEPQSWYLNYVVLFMTVGMCMSQTFRKMTDAQIVHWIRGINK